MSSSDNQINNNQINNKQKQSTKGVKLGKERRHTEERVQLIQLLTPPSTHLDELRVMPVSQLNQLSDVDLVNQALQLVTNDDLYGYTRTGNISIPQLLTMFTTSAKSRDQPRLTKLLKAHVATLKDIAKVDKYIRIGEADDDNVNDMVDDIDSERISDTSVDDLFTSTTKVTDPAASRALKKRVSAVTRPHSTLALATVGVVQQRLPNKRKLNPTQFFGTRIVGRGSHIIASSNPTLAATSLITEQQLLIKESSGTPNSNENLIPIDLTRMQNCVSKQEQVDSNVVLNINNDASVEDDVNLVISAPEDHQAYDSDVNIVFPNAIDNHASDDHKSESSDDFECVDNFVAKSGIVSTDQHLHAEFWGIRSNEFEACFDSLPSDNGYMYCEPGISEDEFYGPLPLTEIISSPARVTLALHSDDSNVLAVHEQQIKAQARFELLYRNWNALHYFQSFPQLQQWLEALTKKDHLFLVYLHAAYLNCLPQPTLTFGNTKSAFWNMINAYGSFRNGIFVVNRRIPLVAVTVDFFLVRTIQDWFDFLDSHNFDIADCWNVTADQVVALRSLQPVVHPQLYVCLATVFELVYYCSNAYRQEESIEALLHRQVYRNRETIDSGLTLTYEDANILLHHYFSGVYKCDQINDDSGFLLLERAVRYVKSPLTRAAVAADCNLQWLRLLVRLFSPATAIVHDLDSEEQARILVAINPRSFSNAELRTYYPVLLKAPGYLLLEYLQHNPMVLHLYGVSSETDRYGILRLKLMGSLIAILQDLSGVDNVDHLLSVSDIAYLSHIGGILHPTANARVIESCIYNIFTGDNVLAQLGALINTRVSPVIAPVPRRFTLLVSAQHWIAYYKQKLSNDDVIARHIQNRLADINKIITIPPAFVNAAPQFAVLHVQALAMTTPAAADDSVRIGARDVKQKYAVLSSVASPPAQINNQQTNEEQALFQRISVGPARALFDNFQIVTNPYSEYVLPTMYAVAEQQCINNWDTAVNFSFVGAGAHYMRTLSLRTMQSRRMQVGDNIVFLYCSTIRFTPDTPFATFHKVTHVWYIVVDVQNDMVYFDKKGLLLNVVQSDLLPLKIKCSYVGTYLQFDPPQPLEMSLPTHRTPI